MIPVNNLVREQCLFKYAIWEALVLKTDSYCGRGAMHCIEPLPLFHLLKQVAKCSDPKEACAAIVAESYRLWLQYETRTDDITIIVVHIQNLDDVCLFLEPLLPAIYVKCECCNGCSIQSLYFVSFFWPSF